jgi:pimeloyl-ACP methyl ester carboxylesterase
LDLDSLAFPIAFVLLGAIAIWLAVKRLLSPTLRSRSLIRRLLERIALAAVLLVATAIAAGSAWNAIALRIFWARHPRPGESYIVGGHAMHINCTGSGSPTIVLESGLGNDGDSLIWGQLQPEIAKTTRVCSYDRAGFGWSEPGPAPRDADRIAAELHELLQKAGVAGPIVLMGHSMAGIYMRDYASRYRSEIAGIEFLDPSIPLQDENPAYRALLAKERPLWMQRILARALYGSGLPRLVGQCGASPFRHDPKDMQMIQEDDCSSHIDSVLAEWQNFNRSGHETAQTGPYGDLPIMIVSEDFEFTAASRNSPRELKPALEAVNAMQEGLKNLSTRSRRIIAKNSGHYVQFARMDLVLKETQSFIGQIRGTLPEPTQYGTTVAE